MYTTTPLPSPYQPGGPILTERQFIGRSDTITRVFSLLEESHENVVVIEGRHCLGKTSLLLQLRRRWGVHDGSVLFSLRDFRADSDIADVLHRLGREVMRATPALPYGVGRSGSSSEQSACHLIDLLNQIAKQRKTKPPFVVMLDDLPAFAPQDRAPKANPARYLEMIVQRCRLTKFVIVQTLEPGAADQSSCASIFRRAHRLTVGNLTRGEVTGVCRLSERVGKTQGLRWTDEAVEAVYGLTDGHPLLAQAVCAGIWQRFAAAEPSHTVECEDLEGDAGLSLLLAESGDALAQIWAKLPVVAQAVLMLVAQQGNVVAVRDLDAVFTARRRWHGALRQACTELRYAGFLVAEGDGVRCSPPLLGIWAQRQDPSSTGEIQQMITATDELPHARSRARTKTPPHLGAPPPI
jgi:hypothetical protein